ncbi:tRNA (adenine(22)-N(1))-methyltransferase [Bacillus kwashiorkori]|uniref:tRNA (adenine(22)-N(1))-methyltransferase n=1 Tax=Bacillus kwashiorkori TaxID=1522318 RepID=UPI000785F63E|nr:tRNA (adenine(22)-N(1))-methyltransferase TrmK [Bacillus kwashiorkori]
MTNNKLSQRLTTVLKYIPKDCIFADIGSDHAYLPIHAIKTRAVKGVIAGEVADGPFEAAKQNVKEHLLQHVIEVRKGDGLTVVKDSEVDCITIAGMGGPLIASILEAGKEKLLSVERLILQPNVAAQIVRKWLMSNGWQLVAEEILEEDGHIYEVLVADKGNPYVPYNDTEKELLFGPYLLQQNNSVFRKKWQREYTNWRQILKQISKGTETSEIKRKRAELTEYINWYLEVFANENSERS